MGVENMKGGSRVGKEQKLHKVGVNDSILKKSLREMYLVPLRQK